jgi:hypothetical protein
MKSEQTYLISSTLSQLFGKIWQQGSLTTGDLQCIKFTLSSNSLCEQEVCAIDRILYAVRRGWLQMID